MGKTVEDAAVLLQTLAGHDPLDGTTPKIPVPDYRGAAFKSGLKGLRIGLPKEYFVEGTDPEIMALVRKAIDGCAKAGAEIVEVSLPHTEYAIAVYYVVATAEASANLARFDGVRYGYRTAAHADSIFDLYAKSRAEGFGTEVKRRIILGTYVLSNGYYDAYYVRAQKVRTLIRNDFQEAFKTCDVLMTPVTPTVAYKIGEAEKDLLKIYLGDVFTVPVNLAGICGMSVPCGKTEAGLPVGLQILGPAFGEQMILRAGHAYEQEVRS